MTAPGKQARGRQRLLDMTLLLVAFVPWFALALPRYFGFRI